MEKKLMFELSDSADVSNICMDLSAVAVWIEAGCEGKTEEELKDMEFTIQPVMMSDEEFDNLPESDL